MCGLLLSNRFLNQSDRESISEALNHRGPDEQNWIVRGQIEALQTRLAIVGLKEQEATQPYRDEGGSFTIFNGELFNYKLWGSTEVGAMHRAVQGRGDPQPLFNGYYATIHYDGGRNEVRAYRDPFGVMPLWYRHWIVNKKQKDSVFELCSEVEPYRRAEWKEVPPGAELRFDVESGALKIKRRPLHHSFPAIETSTAEELRVVFDTAVRRTVLHSEVGYDLALSGGLDSSMILASIKSQDLPLPERIITTYFDEDSDELVRARELVHGFGLEERFLAIKLPPINREFVHKHIEPNVIKDFAFWRHYHVAKNAVSKVLLCGEGADEIGLGYPQNRSYDKVGQYWAKIRWLKSQAVMTLDRVNLAGMANSVEYRVPFLDHDLVRVCLGLDQTQKDKFRVIARKLGVPDSIVDCKKYGSEEARNRK
jgi:asparagine synthase (glutamine-hydrolysing)